MKRWVETCERWLRIDTDGRPELVMRMRAVWMIGLMVVVSQFCNMVVMAFSYGEFVYDHIVAGTAITATMLTIISVRWCKNEFFYAAFYSVLMIGGVLGSALPDHTGINSAAVPILALGPVMIGFMAGRRAAFMFCVVAAVTLGGLYYASLGHASLVAPFDYTRETNRFFQALFAVAISTGIAVIITESLYSTLSELRDTASRATRAEAAKSEFLATMSHELRTPLNGVIGLTDALLNGALPDHERKLTETIRKSGEQLLLILNDLLDLSKIEAGKLKIEARPADLRDIVRFAVDSWRETATAKGLSVSANVTGEVPASVLVDDLRLRQILQNLMSNGVKFTREGQVVLHLHGISRGGNRYALEFRVIDTGKGIPDKEVARVFDPFEQGERGTTRKFGGTGLGLPICRMLAQLMGGAIGVERTGPAGSTFLLSLKVNAAELDDAAGDDVYDAASDLRGLRVLVAEDNEVNRMVVSEFLKSWGADADFAHDGPACLERVNAGVYDMVLMDKHMPGMSGMETAQAIRKSGGPMANMPIIAVSADAMPGEREAMLACGMNDFITKPLRAEALKAVILRALKNRAAA
ncbi:ATP-binding protein [Hyphococcus sp.]|uniref:ATP-binding protein n=1 Tax=Hyphococcus sp. TaxID=2038636 RepID=UPI0020849CF5|nr:MAG: hybrid sensor histidine kinase/response regulator [Marinicaulis sp.]